MDKRPRRSLKFSAGACFFILASILLPLANAVGQTSGDQSAGTGAKIPAYDVVSVKVNKTGSGNWGSDSDIRRYSASNVSLKNLISGAYGIKEDLIYGIPGWASSTRFDVEAKIVDPDLDALKKLSPKQEQSLMKPVLADRFQLAAHTETKILPVFEMVLTKGGLKFKPTPPNDPSGRGGGTSIHNAALTAHAISMSSLANSLSHQLHRTVIDETGLTGKFDLAFSWTPAHAPDVTPEDSESSIFTALQEQLGLKLRSSKGPVETLVIDHVEMPSEN